MPTQEPLTAGVDYQWDNNKLIALTKEVHSRLETLMSIGTFPFIESQARWEDNSTNSGVIVFAKLGHNLDPTDVIAVVEHH